MAERTKGFVQLENRLVEAMIDAGFVGSQLLIMLVLARLTIGWNRKTASMLAIEIARYAGLSPTGGFRRALRELVQNGVVIEMHEGNKTTYALQPDYASWGRFSTSETKLAAIWDRRPASDDALLRHLAASGQLTLQGHLSAVSIEDPDDPAGSPKEQADDPTGSPPEPPGVPQKTPQGRGTEDKSLFGEDVEGRKDIEIQETQKTTATAAREVVGGNAPARVAEPTPPIATAHDEQTRQYAIKLSVAVNRAIGTRWFKGENPHPVVYATGLDLAAELRAVSVPLELAESVIASVCATSRNAKPMSTVSYFRQPIMDAARVEEQRVLNADAAGTRRGGAPASIAVLVDPEKGKRSIERHDADVATYQQERTAAAITWGKDEANAKAYTAIALRAKTHFEGQSGSWLQAAHAEMIVNECAKAAKFPDFDTWIQARSAEPAGV
jgi:phage replication O-like protein O